MKQGLEQMNEKILKMAEIYYRSNLRNTKINNIIN